MARDYVRGAPTGKQTLALGLSENVWLPRETLEQYKQCGGTCRMPG